MDKIYSPFGHRSGNKFLARVDGMLKERNVALRCDFPSEAKGNCFPYAISQQLHLPSISCHLCDAIKKLSKNYHDLRLAIINFVKYIKPSSKYYERINHSRLAYMELHPDQNILSNFSAWDMKLQRMRRNGEWFDEQFVKFTAFLLNLDIVCVIRTQTIKYCADPRSE